MSPRLSTRAMTSAWTHADVNEARVRVGYDKIAFLEPKLLERHPTDWNKAPGKASDGITLKLREVYSNQSLVLPDTKPTLLFEDIWRYAVGDRAEMSTTELVDLRQKDIGLLKRVVRLSPALNVKSRIYRSLGAGVGCELQRWTTRRSTARMEGKGS
jgi:hypothetical protein